MSDINKLLSLVASFEAEAVSLKPRYDITSYWRPHYFETEEEALKSESAGIGSKAENFLDGWLITKDGKVFTDKQGKDYTKNDIEIIRSGKPLSKDLKKRLRGLDIAAGKNIDDLVVIAKKKLDPKAQVRNRGKVIFPAERSKDHTDHYPINNIDEARAALRYAGKQKSAPWYHGTVEEMKKAVQRAAYKNFPTLKPEKKSFEIFDAILKVAEEKYEPTLRINIIEDLAKELSELETEIKGARSKLHKLHMEKSEFNFRGGPESEKTRINRGISEVGTEILGLELEKAKISDQIKQLQGLEQAVPMDQYDSPSDYYSGGAADDGSI